MRTHAQSCLTLCNPVDGSPPGSSVHGISQQEHWSGSPFPSPGDLSNPGVEPGSPALQAGSLPLGPPGKPIVLGECLTVNFTTGSQPPSLFSLRKEKGASWILLNDYMCLCAHVCTHTRVLMAGLPWWLSGKDFAHQSRRHGSYFSVRKTPWRRTWQPTPAFLPGESHGQRSLGGQESRGSQKSRTRLSDRTDGMWLI